MKKIISVIVISFFTFCMKGQESNIIGSISLPMGYPGDNTKFGLNLDANYIWDLSGDFDLGVTTGYHYYFGESDNVSNIAEDSEFNDVGFMPIAAVALINLSKELSLGTDIGYALGISPNGNDGGFYYAPKIQYCLIPSLRIVLVFQSVKIERGSFDALTLGFEISV